MRRYVLLALVAVLASALAIPAATSGRNGPTREYVVLYADGASLTSARAAIKRLGGRIVKENRVVGLATVQTNNRNFMGAIRSDEAIAGAARNHFIGRAKPTQRAAREALERVQAARAASLGTEGATVTSDGSGGEPLADRQWDMRMIHATPGESYEAEPGDPGVRVGIIDTGIEGSHPDIAPNFDAGLSRNFTTDIPLVDGPCEDEPDHSCSDPANVDENSHGTHVAGTVASPLNGEGIGGVAPSVTLVNLRAGQDSGYFFLQPTVDALTYAGDHGIDVANMSYYVDPWLYNCGPANPATDPETGEPSDSAAEQGEQQMIIDAVQEAVNYARAHGVTLIGAEGNSHTDLGNPTFDDTSPDFPPGTERPRNVTNACLDVPTELAGVLSVSALGPSERKAYYSNYGVEQTTVSAPGGDFRDFIGTKQYQTPENLILAPYPEAVAREFGEIKVNGKPNTPFVVRDCTVKKYQGECAYYQYLQGTSMASPHAVGVAALIVSKYGTPDATHGGLTLDPAVVENLLTETASDRACPNPRLFVYPDRTPDHNAFCAGTAEFNGFYGHGIVNAFEAVR